MVEEARGREQTARDRDGTVAATGQPFSFRFDPPVSHSERVQRRRLTHALTASRERLVLIVAPAGYGKTTLAAQWRELDDRIFAWVMLGPGTRDTLELWSYIVQSVGRAVPDLASTVERLGFWLTTAEPDTIAPKVAEALAGVGRELVIVLDDYHDVKGASVHSTIGSFVDRIPPVVQLAVVSRRDPPFAVGRLRASGDLLELRATDLAFRDEEIDQLVNRGLQLDLSPAAIAMLATRTEGWPAGVALACMSLRNLEDREGFIERFSGSNRFVVDYLTEVVLEGLEPPQRSFLVETSILERMSGELCDVVLERNGSADLLSEIQKEDLFLTPLDEHADWYRYHPVFREFLLRELRLRDPARVPALRRRAFDWLAREGILDDAVRQAFALHAYDEAARLVCENWLPLSVPRTIGMLQGWIDEFPKDVLRANAALCIARGCVLRLLGDYQGALHAIADARAAEWTGPLPDGQSSVEAAAEMLRASMIIGDVSEQLRAARRGFELASDGAPTFRMLTRAFLGRALHWNGDQLGAKGLVEQAAEEAAELEIWQVVFDTRATLAMIALEEGQPDVAERHARDALELAETRGFETLNRLGVALLPLGRVLAGRGELAEADGLLTRALERMRAYREVLLIADCLLALALVRRALGAPEEARELLAEATNIVEASTDPGIIGGRLEEAKLILGRPVRRIRELGELTDRELDVLRLLADGRTKREIGGTLFLSYNTIHSHTKSIYRKLDATSRDEALARARELELIR